VQRRNHGSAIATARLPAFPGGESPEIPVWFDSSNGFSYITKPLFQTVISEQIVSELETPFKLDTGIFAKQFVTLSLLFELEGGTESRMLLAVHAFILEMEDPLGTDVLHMEPEHGALVDSSATLENADTEYVRSQRSAAPLVD